MKKVLLSISLLFIVFVSVIFYRMWNLEDLQPKTTNQTSQNLTPLDSAAERLAKAISFQTISHHPAMMDTATFNAFHHWLFETYPNLFSKTQVDTFSTHTLVLKWSGESSENPILFMAHQDVVPVDLNANWEFPPFGDIPQGEYVYGRGTLDDKGSMMAIIEAAEALIQMGFVPSNDIYISLGQDEEIGGKNGAKIVAEYFKSNGIRFAYVLDEGGIISEGIIPGITEPIALIGTSEKGYISIDVESEFRGGHSSMPADTNAITLAAEVITRMKSNPFEFKIGGSMEGFLNYLGPYFPTLNKMAAANRWAFEGLIINAYSKSPSGAALIHTTCTPTIITAGIKDNVTPMRSLVTFNSRILPGESTESVFKHYEEVLADLPVTLSIHDNFSENPSPISTYQSEAFQHFAELVKTNYPECLVSPYMVLGATDARYMTSLSDNVYRFMPFRFSKEDLPRLHGVNERVKIHDYTRAISFYMMAMTEMSKS